MRALVVGSGVAGPAVALFLRRIGWDVQVVEATDASQAAAGAFLNIATNGQAVLAELGLREAVMSQAHPCPRMVMWSGLGKRLGEVPNGPAGDPARGSAVVARAWLHRVLRDAVSQAGIPLTSGVPIVQVNQTGDGLVAVAGDGQVFSGDVVVGADGVGSVLRRFIDPEAPSPAYTGMVGLGGFAHPAGLAPTPGVQHFVFGRRSFFGYLVREDRTALWFGNLTHPDPDRDALRAVHAAAWLERLRQLHSDDLEPVPTILAAADDTVGAYPIHDLAQVPHWHRGRAVCIGDAVHATDPSAGQGASLALEDAQVLAQCLRDISPIESALATFHRLRHRRAEAVVAYARTIGRRKQVSSSRLAMGLRDLMLPLFLRRAASDTTQNWLYDYQVDWATQITADMAPADIEELRRVGNSTTDEAQR